MRKFSLYREASEELRSEMAAAAETVHLTTGAYFYHAGDRCARFALLGAGDIRVFRTSETGREITLYHVQEGETCLVNILGLLLDQPAMASAVAESPSDAVIMPGEFLRRWVSEQTIVQRFVFESMGQRLVDVMTLVEEVAFRKMDQRTASYLLHRFAGSGLGTTVLSTTHEEIASELGTAREVISRVLKEFERAGVIALSRGRLELVNAAGLQSFSGDADRSPAER